MEFSGVHDLDVSALVNTNDNEVNAFRGERSAGVPILISRFTAIQRSVVKSTF
jgi:hypothetical protein